MMPNNISEDGEITKERDAQTSNILAFIAPGSLLHKT